MQSSVPSWRIGTRGSPLALAQSHEVRARLAAVHGIDEAAIEIRVIRTSGDRIQDRPLAEVGGKGLFTKEIEEALLDRTVDLAVHSAKDMPTVLPDGLALAACLKREDPRDAFISHKAKDLSALAPGSRLGTASLRRQALAARLRPDIAIVPLRGNVETRLRKLADGEVDATLLALAGLKRLGLADKATALMDPEEFIPAVGQGIIAIETRADDARIWGLVAAINHADSSLALATERAFLAVLDGSCRTPIAGHATVSGEAIRFRGMVLRPDGSEAHAVAREGGIAAAAALGADAGRELKSRMPADFLFSLSPSGRGPG